MVDLENRVYYFSGTGNSYYVAKSIAQRIDGKLYPITSLKEDDTIEANILCFVFPVYDFKPPKIVSKIIENIASIRATKVVAIATYGVALSATLIHFKGSLAKNGTLLTHGYGVKAPHNAMGSIRIANEENNTRLELAEERIVKITERIVALSSDSIQKTSLFEDYTIIKNFSVVIKLLSILIFKGASSLSFKVTDSCIKCHLCEKICPVDNIKWDEEKDNPIFENRCTSCFACVQWCPNKAIQFGNYSFTDLGVMNYNHPKVTAHEMILLNQKKQD